MRPIQSTILIPILEVESIVHKWRNRYQDSALRGMPPHITLLFPFLNPTLIDNGAINILTMIFKNTKIFQFSFKKISVFPGVIYLEPFPKNPFIELTRKIVEIYPDLLPYGGEFHGINPHLTLARLSDKNNFPEILNRINEDLSSKLPLKSSAKGVWLMEKDEENFWHIKLKLPFSKY